MKTIKFCLLVLSFILAISCKKTSHELEPEDNSKLTAINPDLYPMKIGIINSENITFTSNIYDATMGGQSIKLALDSLNKTLNFLAPSLPEGNYEMDLKIADKNFKLNYHIKKANEITNLDVTINNALNNLIYTDPEFDSIQLALKDFEGNENSLDNTTMLKNYANTIKGYIPNLSQQDKIDLANFISSNPILFSRESNPIDQIDSFTVRTHGTAPEHILEHVLDRMRVEKNKLAVCAGVSVIGFAFGNPVLGSIFAFAGIYKIYQINDNNIVGLSKALSRFGELITDDISAQKSQSMFTFNKDQNYILKVKSSYRNPNNSDANSNNPIMTEIVSLLDYLGENWQKASVLISKFGYQLKGNPFNIKNINSTRSKIFIVNPNFITISNISNPNVTANLNETSTGWQMQFTTQETTNQSFSFDIKYKSNTGESTLNFSGTLQTTTANIVLSTTAPTSIAMTSAILGGIITNDGFSPITARGICYDTNPNPTIANNTIGSGSGIGSFSVELDGLLPNTVYYARACAVNANETTYGNEFTFKTLSKKEMLFQSGWNVVSATSNCIYGSQSQSQTIGPNYTLYNVCSTTLFFPLDYYTYTNPNNGWNVYWNAPYLNFKWSYTGGTSKARSNPNCGVSTTFNLAPGYMSFGVFEPLNYNEQTNKVPISGGAPIEELTVLSINNTSATIKIVRYAWQQQTTVINEVTLILQR